ncbi:MAG: N-6 DNA methylase, partial [Planctomycetes bacterium]|nr:N-6 DNA methylase [Planctomycetota bacterium]
GNMKQIDIGKAIQVFRKNFKNFSDEIVGTFIKISQKIVDIDALANDSKRICLQLLILEIVREFEIVEKASAITYIDFFTTQDYWCLQDLGQKNNLLSAIDFNPKSFLKIVKNMRKCLMVSNFATIQDVIYLLIYCFESIIELSFVQGDNNAEGLKVGVSDSRKKSGAFFTPKSLVKYTVKTAFDRFFQKPSQNVSELRICDPALGGGLFLLEAANSLAQKFCTTKDKSKFFKKLCENNFYGVDTNPLAVEISVISLKLLCNPQILDENMLTGRFKVGDSLNGTTNKRLNNFKAGINKGKIKLTKTESGKRKKYTRKQLDDWCSLWFQNLINKDLCDKINNFAVSPKVSNKSLKRENIFHWELEFPEIFTANRSGFDVIISNPPYRSYYSRHSGKNADESVHFERFAVSNLSEICEITAVAGRINNFLLFIVKASELMRENGGVCAFVLPDTILINESYASMRFALIKAKYLIEAAQFTNQQFRGATVGTSVLCWQKASNNDEIILKKISEDAKTQKISVNQTTVKYAKVLSRPHHSLLYSSQIQTFDSTKYLKLDEIAFVRDGINPGKRKMREKLVTTVQGEKTRKLIEGCNIKRFTLTWSGKYIIYDDAEISTQDKLDGTSLRKQWIFDSPKIVYRQTSPEIISTVDLHKFCTLNSVQNIILRKNDEDLLFALCGYLNSEFLREIYQSQTGETRKTYPQVHVSAVKMLLIPRFLIDYLNFIREIAEISRKLTNNSSMNAKNVNLKSETKETEKVETLEHLARKIEIIINAKLSDY